MAATVGVVLGGAGRRTAGRVRPRPAALPEPRLGRHAGPAGPGGEARLEAVAAADGVATVGAMRELFVRPAGSDLFPDYNLLAVAPCCRPRRGHRRPPGHRLRPGARSLGGGRGGAERRAGRATAPARRGSLRPGVDDLGLGRHRLQRW